MPVSDWDSFVSSFAKYPIERSDGLCFRSEFNRASGLRLALVEVEGKQGWGWLRKTWQEVPRGGCGTFLLLVAQRRSGRGWLCGWEDDAYRIVEDDLACLAAVCERAFAERQDLVLWERLESAFDALGEGREAILGLRHGGLFSRHYMTRRAWNVAAKREGSMCALLGALKEAGEGEGIVVEGGVLLRLLGFEVAEGGRDSREAVLRVEDRERAFALVLREGEGADYSVVGLSERRTAAGYAIDRARSRGLPFALVVSKGVLRLYVRRGLGGDGVSDDVLGGDFSERYFLEADVSLSQAVWRHGRSGGGDEDGKLERYEGGLRALAMLFSGIALGERGLLAYLASESRSFVREVAAGLRRRIYTKAMPRLAEALAAARGLERPCRKALDETYEMAMRVLFRLLFVAYAEDKGLIPSADEREDDGDGDRKEGEQKDLLQEQQAQKEYKKRSLKSKARELAKELELGGEERFDRKNIKHWQEVNQLFTSIDGGDRQMGLPAYNGGLFARQAWEGGIVLTDFVFAPILQNLLLEDSGEGARGPVDFADLSVRELGTIYEGLLESELSRAEEDLTIEGEKQEKQDSKRSKEKGTKGAKGKNGAKKERRGLYRPMRGAKAGSEVIVEAGKIYVHNTSGERKSTGSYYTPDFCVEHLLDRALEPALEAHFARLDDLGEGGGKEGGGKEGGGKEGKGEIGSEVFFDVRVADIAMGSGHFLVAAAERMAERFTAYYKQHRGRLREVAEGVERLRETAEGRLRDVSAPVPRLLRKKEEGQAEGREGAEGWEGEEMLLRRQVVGRCLYGVDRNDLAVQLARVSLWIHSFVPGLPLSYLDRNLRHGDSLVGVGTIGEIEDKVRAEGEMFKSTAEEFLGEAKEPLRQLSGNLQSSVAEVKDAEKATKEIEEKLRATEAWCDLMTAARIDPKQPSMHSSKWLKEKRTLVETQMHREAKKTLEGLLPVHFPTAFPEVFLRERQGFDVILGNPPWKKLVCKEDEFWIRYFPRLGGKHQATQEKYKENYRETRPDLVRLYMEERDKHERTRKMLHKSAYGDDGKGFGAGDLDLYKVFSWRYWQLLAAPQDEQSKGGYLGVVMSRSLLNTKGSQEFRQKIFSQTNHIDITTIVNRNQWCFADVTPQFAMALLTFDKSSERTNAKIYLRGPYNSREKFDKRREKSPEIFQSSEVITWNESATLPSFPTAESPVVFNQLRLSPSLNHDDGETWLARPYSELHGTSDKPLMEMTSEQQPEGTWPVYKGESFDLWQADRGKDHYYAWAKPQPVLDMLQTKRLRGANNKNSSFSEFPAKDIKKPETLSCYHSRLVFRDIARATDKRTVVCCLIPPKTFCANTAPVFLFPRGDEHDQTYLLGILCSRPLDWYARRFVELHMNHHIVNSLPVPRPAANDPLRLRLIQLAGRLASQDARLQPWAERINVDCGILPPQEQHEMTCELDAVSAHLYGLSRDHLTHIFQTFHEGWNYQPILQQTLRHYDAWQQQR